MLGTPEYMAPEQAAGAKDMTTAADVYGLGAVLYTMLAGEPPFRAPTVYETVRRVVEDAPAPPRTLRGTAPRDLETICLKCLEKEPARRYASAKALADDLGRWLKGEPIAARPAGLVERLRKWARRRPTAAALVTVCVVSLAALLGGGIYSANHIARQNYELRVQSQDLTAALDTVKQNEHLLTTKQAELEANAKQLNQTVATLRRNEYTLELEQYRGKLVEVQRELAAANKQKASQILDECQWDLRNWEFDYLAECCKDKPAIVLMGDEPTEAPRPDPTTRAWPKETRSLAFTPDGKHLVTTVRGRLTVFDTATGKALRTIDENRTWDAFALSPDGKLLACYDASAAGVVVMEFETGKSRGGVGTGTVRGSGIGSAMDTFAKKGLAFNPDSKRLLVGSTVFDVATGSGVVLKYQLSGATSRSDGWDDVGPFSPDGKFVAMSFNPVNLDEKNQAAVWDAHTGEVRAWLKGDPQGFSCLAFSPAGDRIAIGGHRNAVELFDPNGGSRLFACEAPTPITCVTFTRDGRRLITGDASGAVQIWDAHLGREILALPPIAKGGAVHALSISPDGSKLAAVLGTAVGGQRVVIRRGSDAPPAGVLSSPVLTNHSLKFGAGADRVVALPRDPSRESSVVAAFDTRAGKALFQIPATYGGLVHPTERRVVLVNGKTIDLDTGATVVEWPADAVYSHPGNPYAFRPDRASITPDGKYLVHLHDVKGFSLFDLATGRGVGSYQFPDEDRRSNAPFAMHPDGKQPFVATNDSEQDSFAIRAWKMPPPETLRKEMPDATDGKLPTGRLEAITRLVGHTAPVRCLAISPDGLFVASGGDDRTVRVWDAENGKQLRVLEGRPWSVQHLGFSPDGRYLFVGPGWANAPAELWRMGRWDQPAPLGANGHGGFDAFAFTPDSRTLRLLAGSRCFEWDVRSGKATRPHRDVSFLKRLDQTQPAAAPPRQENLP